MANKRPKGILGVGWACLEASLTGRVEHRPTVADYPETMIRRGSFIAGGGLGWRVSALATVRKRPAPWRIVVVTGAPSWAEYWAPVMAALPPDREMIVVDRPGFAASEPFDCVPDIRLQARALAPLIAARPRQNTVLIGQSYGGAIATLMADAEHRNVASLVLLSSYLGKPGPTAHRLLQLGSRMAGVIPRDLRNAVREIVSQPNQLPAFHEALARLPIPVHVLHGDLDDFAPIETARALTGLRGKRRPVRFESINGADHFINESAIDVLLRHIEACIPKPGRLHGRPIFDWLTAIGGRASALTAT